MIPGEVTNDLPTSESPPQAQKTELFSAKFLLKVEQ